MSIMAILEIYGLSAGNHSKKNFFIEKTLFFDHFELKYENFFLLGGPQRPCKGHVLRNRLLAKSSFQYSVRVRRTLWLSFSLGTIMVLEKTQ